MLVVYLFGIQQLCHKICQILVKFIHSQIFTIIIFVLFSFLLFVNGLNLAIIHVKFVSQSIHSEQISQMPGHIIFKFVMVWMNVVRVRARA